MTKSVIDDIPNFGPVVLLYGATWCASCKQLSAKIDTLDEVQVPVLKIDVDSEPELTKKFGVRSLPTMVFLLDGNEVKRSTGFNPTTLNDFLKI